MKERFLLVLENGKHVCARTHFDVLGDFAFSSFKTYTVKCLDKEDSDSQGHSKYISIKGMS